MMHERITVRARAGVDLDLAVDQVDDPIDGYAATRIVDLLFSTIPRQRRIRNLDQDGHIGRHRVTILIGVGIALHHREIWQWFLSAMHLDRLIFSDEPAIGQHSVELAP